MFDALDLSPEEDRALGAVLGLAVGDALGTTLEFSARDSKPWHTEITGGGPFGLPAGVWTDDTSMALALAESLAGCGGLDAQDLMQRFLAWRRRGEYSPTGTCFDIGNTTVAALAHFERTGDPWAGSASPSASGNGGLMRLAPAAVLAWRDEDAAGRLAREQSRTTHASAECLTAADYMGRVLARAIEGLGRDAAFAAKSPEPASPRLAAVMGGAWRGRARSKISSSGYVVDSLEAALWSVSGADGFEAAVITAVNLGDDADTVGAITGQIAGALWGASAIPPRWLAPLAWRDRLIDVALTLARAGAEH